MIRIIFICCSLIFTLQVQGQSLIPFAAASAGQSTWSAGELQITTLSHSDGKITQGFQQPNQKNVVVDPPINEVPLGFPPGLSYFNGLTSTSSANANFLIEGIEQYKEYTLVITNRWGDLLYTITNNYDNNWNGTDQKGTQLPQGTYYYMLSVKNYKAVKGSIHIIR